METNKRKTWIDFLRGICMLAILLDHTEIYYTGTNIINYNVYVTDALYLFFFISGYLIYKDGKAFDLKKKTLSICRSLIMPYFIFATALAIPKAVAHNNNIDLFDVVWNIITGQASWFVIALAVSELIFATTIRLCKNNIAILTVASIAAYAGAVTLAEYSKNGYAFQIDNALLAMPILLVGYTYHKYEDYISNNIAITIAAFFILVLTKIYVAYTDTLLLIWHINISSYAIFTINVIAGCIAIVGIFKKLPPCRPIEWIGRHSLIYYFLCGGIPLTTSKMLCKIGFEYNGCYLNMLVAYAIVCATSTLAVAFIYKYIPFVTGARRTNCAATRRES